MHQYSIYEVLGRICYLTLADISILAVYIRRLAEMGISVTINWPRSYKGRRSRLQKVLEGLRFADLFEKDLVHDWSRYVTIEGRPSMSREFKFDPETAHYVPMRWLDIHSYDIESNVNILDGPASSTSNT